MARSGRGLSLREKNVLAIHHDFAALIENFAGFDDTTVSGPLGLFVFFLDGDASVNGVADEDRLGKAEALVAVGEGDRINLRGGEADTDCESHGAVGDTAAEWSGAGKFLVDVMREKIAAMTGMNDDIGFSDGAAGGFALGANDVLLKVFRFIHGDWLRREEERHAFRRCLR